MEMSMMAMDLMDMVSNQDDQPTKQCVYLRSCLCWLWRDPGVERTGDGDDDDDEEEGGGDNDEDDNEDNYDDQLAKGVLLCFWVWFRPGLTTINNNTIISIPLFSM